MWSEFPPFDHQSMEHAQMEQQLLVLSVLLTLFHGFVVEQRKCTHKICLATTSRLGCDLDRVLQQTSWNVLARLSGVKDTELVMQLSHPQLLNVLLQYHQPLTHKVKVLNDHPATVAGSLCQSVQSIVFLTFTKGHVVHVTLTLREAKLLSKSLKILHWINTW